jgi:hypothetical protein
MWVCVCVLRQGAHGVDGMLKVRATSDVGEEALTTTGLRHIKVCVCECAYDSPTHALPLP